MSPIGLTRSVPQSDLLQVSPSLGFSLFRSSGDDSCFLLSAGHSSDVLGIRPACSELLSPSGQDHSEWVPSLEVQQPASRGAIIRRFVPLPPRVVSRASMTSRIAAFEAIDAHLRSGWQDDPRESLRHIPKGRDIYKLYRTLRSTLKELPPPDFKPRSEYWTYATPKPITDPIRVLTASLYSHHVVVQTPDWQLSRGLLQSDDSLLREVLNEEEHRDEPDLGRNEAKSPPKNEAGSESEAEIDIDIDDLLEELDETIATDLEAHLRDFTPDRVRDHVAHLLAFLGPLRPAVESGAITFWQGQFSTPTETMKAMAREVPEFRKELRRIAENYDIPIISAAYPVLLAYRLRSTRGSGVCWLPTSDAEQEVGEALFGRFADVDEGITLLGSGGVFTPHETRPSRAFRRSFLADRWLYELPFPLRLDAQTFESLRSDDEAFSGWLRDVSVVLNTINSVNDGQALMDEVAAQRRLLEDRAQAIIETVTRRKGRWKRSAVFGGIGSALMTVIGIVRGLEGDQIFNEAMRDEAMRNALLGGGIGALIERLQHKSVPLQGFDLALMRLLPKEGLRRPRGA